MFLKSQSSAALLPQPAKDAVLQQLETILASPEFSRAERMRRFLRHAVENSLAGNLDLLKESVIGVEVFDRTPSYNPKIDPIVRIEARRLRAKLKEYYDSEGKEDHVRIDLPKGGYLASVAILNRVTKPEDQTHGRPISPVDEDAAEEFPLLASAAVPRWQSAFSLRLILALLLITGLFAAAASIFWKHTVREREIHPPLAVHNFTSFPGAEIQPSFSADGSKVAFIGTGAEPGLPTIYIQQVDSFTPVQLTTRAAGQLSHPVWSPDGKEIAFLRRQARNRFEVCVINVATRFIRVRAEVESVDSQVGPENSLDWSPDGRYLATTHRKNLVLISMLTGEMRQLTTAPSDALGDFEGIFSPDARRVTFRRAVGFGLDDLYIVPIEGGPPGQLTRRRTMIRGHTWTADGRSIVFSEQHSLWRVPATGGEPRRVTDGTVKAIQPVASRVGNRLVFTDASVRIRVWRLPLDKPGAPEEVLASTLTDVSPDVSPDGHRLAFRSDRSGSDEIWLSDSDGKHPTRLTRFGGPLTGCPRWSPDGSEIAFDSRPTGRADIFIVTVANGRVRQLTRDPSDEVVPSWSRDGHFVYFASMRTGSWQVWKQPVAGGPAIQVTKSGGFASFESADGKYVYYAKDRFGSGLWRVPTVGGAEELITSELEPGMWGNWCIGANSILFGETKPPFRVRALSSKTMLHTEITRLPSEPLIGDVGMALSPDGAWLYVSLADPPAGDLYMVEHFK